MTESIINTVRQRCRRCYSCIRHCPTKAIAVRNAQAEVIAERCVACGRCVRICTQSAKSVLDNLPLVRKLLNDSEADPVVMVAPAFPAAFPRWRPGQVIAALRQLGFKGVYEVAFGADLVSRACRNHYFEYADQITITTPCPAAVGYIQKFAPELLPFLAPIVSPMAAMGKAIKQIIRPGASTIFVGPCTAKICEAQEPEITPWVDGVITFTELLSLFEEMNIEPAQLPDESMDPPHSYRGGIFPMPGGLLRAAELPDDLLNSRVATVVGMQAFIDTVSRLKQRMLNNSLHEVEINYFDVLFCRGCVDGPVMGATNESLLMMRQRITSYMRDRVERPSRETWQGELEKFIALDLRRSFRAEAQTMVQPSEDAIRQILSRTGKDTPAQELNCGACGYHTCREKAIAVYEGLAEVEMCLPYLVEQLQETVEQLHVSHNELQETQEQLIRSERLASMGQLAAGIAHEINNPLGTILIYAHLLQEQAAAAPELRGDSEMILHEATRCKKIVCGLLDFARQNKVQRRTVDLRELIEESITLVRAQTPEGAVKFILDVPANLSPAQIDPDQIKQVLVNLIRNAVDVVTIGGEVRISVETLDTGLRILVRDNGPGIAAEHMNQLFSPFFTTKPVGQGTGLGLPICYGIVKMHRGSISAQNNEDGPGATFIVNLPKELQP